ncbi:phage tail protein [Roseateles amylovorans]|jgi:phage tail-like protein|uniref:Phage tail protein n=1 Tax=Roseateles amylovorans TaxID=2978473 RepID=A0ABY6B1Z9_9BURK|nr:phage tail protein [Roseateles amylovorans]UXH79425.1 phage tail protein [Roseateles amylovorans]
MATTAQQQTQTGSTGRKRESPLTQPVTYPYAFYFAVAIGKTNARDIEASFQEVGGLSVEMDIETVVEGGRNESVHQLPKPVKYPRLTLKRGVAELKSPLVQWCKNVLEGALAKRIETQPLTVRLMDREGQPLRIWAFTDAFPVKWEVDGLESTGNKLALERIELVHGGWKRVV